MSRDIPAQLFAAPEYVHASFGHVSYPSSPGRGMVWKVQRSVPVLTS